MDRKLDNDYVYAVNATYWTEEVNRLHCIHKNNLILTQNKTAQGWGIEGVQSAFVPFNFPSVSSLKTVSTSSRDFQGIEGVLLPA